MDNENNIKYYAQELKQNTYNLTRMNLIMRGILPSNIMTRNGDTLEEDWPYFDEMDPIGTYDPLYVDAVVSNPPYSQSWDPEGKETDSRYARFGLAPRGKADYAFLLHDLFHIKSDGIMTIVLPHGVLFRGGEEATIRKNLIESNHIDCIIGLPANIFFGTGIPTIIMVLKQKRDNTDVLIIDASKGFTKEGKNNKLRSSDIKRISDTVKFRRNVEKYSRVVSREEIRENEYNLNIPRYVDSSEPTEQWDIFASMYGGIPKNEINDLEKYWKIFPNLKDSLFTKDSGEHVQVVEGDLQTLIENHPEVQAFQTQYRQAFGGFEEVLEKRLIEDMFGVQLSREESILSDDIFNRLKTVPLVDEYKAYQILDDHWKIISGDLEIIQTEGYEAIRNVQPNLVLKTKNGKDVEVQDGWVGRVLPLELVQVSLLKEELKELKKNESNLSQINTEKDELVESLSEEEKEELSDVLNDDNSNFQATPVKRLAKELLKKTKICDYDEDSTEAKVIRMNNLLVEEKELKKVIKSKSEELTKLSKFRIENLVGSSNI